MPDAFLSQRCCLDLLGAARLSSGRPETLGPAASGVKRRGENQMGLLATFPVTAGTTHAVLLNAEIDASGWEIVDGSGGMVTVNHVYKNNLYSFWPSENSTSGVSLEALTKTWCRFDFTLQWLGTDHHDWTFHDGGLEPFGTLIAALQTRADANPVSGHFFPDLSASPLSVEWSAGSAPGLAIETYKSFGTEIGSLEIDPGFGSGTFGGDVVVGRKGRRYTFLLSGNEYRLYVDYTPAGGQKPLAIVSGADGLAFPLRFIAQAEVGTNSSDVGFGVLNIIAAGDLNPTLIISKRDQERLGIYGSGFKLKIYQKGNYGVDGIPVEIDVPAS